MKRRFLKAVGLVALALAIFAILAPSADARPLDRGSPVASDVRTPTVKSESNGFAWKYVWVSLGAAAGLCLLAAGVVGTRTGRVVWSIPR